MSYALAATAHLDRVVVGLGDDVPADVPVVCESPPGGGPVAGIAAGVDALARGGPYGIVVVLAADLPLIARTHVDRLVAATDTRPTVFADPDGRLQWLAAAWPAPLLATTLTALGDAGGQSMRRLYGGVDPRSLPDPDRAASTDVDTPDDLKALDGDATGPRRFPRAAEEDT